MATSGTVLMARMASFSMRMDSSIEILGTRTITGVIEPSCMVGMKAVPRNGTTPRLAPRATRAVASTFLG